MYRLILSGFVLILCLQPSFAETIADYRDRFVNSSRQECVKIQRAAKENQGITDGQIDLYCGCVISNVSDVLTLNELEEMERTGINPKSVQTKMNHSGASCAAGNLDTVLIQRGKSGCVAKNRAAIAYFTEAKIDEYCDCLHRHVVRDMTKDQKIELFEAEKPGQWLQTIVDAADGLCRRTVLRK